ncbi:hypothetical protein DOTSEDRAFT_75726 [Dothistroma septosporum NZE10]|uniref:LIP-domain-containing protein n=1 Tax=Dothistroma septosporum (strain NZE10 / CBS 128990) TaxID=675120 RepID=N1PDH8_DOTSN|nr:hypothetical protein DOTSEDRAFT_75726 [Dothistroma septosporum NZE10]
MILHWLRSICLLPLVPLVLTAAIDQPVKRAIVPDNDPFYQPPAGFASTAPGTILKTRIVISSLLGLVPTVVQTYQILYRTTAINGSAYAAATTVFKPLGAKTDRFVSFHTAYDGSATICDPSYNYQLGAIQADLISDVEFLLLEGFLLSGYIVSSPDYEGPEAAFGAGRLAGMATLDSMRAVTAFKSTLGFTTSTPSIVGYGYSGGSIASGWGSQLQSSYAPDLNIKGWAAGGTVANLTGTALFISNTAFSGFSPAVVDGLSKPTAYGTSLGAVITSIITPLGQSKLDFANKNCIADLLNFFETSFLSTTIQTLGNRLFYQPTIASILSQQTMGTSKNETPTVPVYVYHASDDEIIPYANATTLVDSWCNNGAAVDFVTFGNGGHFTTEILGFVGAYQFVQDAFAGTVAKTGCTRSTTLNDTLDPLALGVDLEPVLVELINALAALGREDSNVQSDIGTLDQTVSF